MAILVLLLLPATFFLSQKTATCLSLAIDSIICNAAFRSLGNSSTAGVLYEVQLPANLSADVSRYRSGSLRRYGATIGEFKIPRGVAVRPYARRLVLIRENLGSFSSIYRDILGFQLASPVVGLRAFEFKRSCVRELELVANGEPIVVNLTNVALGNRHSSLCAYFNMEGAVSVFDAVSPGVCVTRTEGRFALVARRRPRMETPAPSGDCDGQRNDRRGVSTRWKAFAVTALTGVFMATLLGMVGVAVLKTKRRRRKMEEMERKAYENEALRVSMFGHVPASAPAAGASRTAGEIEEEEHIPPL